MIPADSGSSDAAPTPPRSELCSASTWWADFQIASRHLHPNRDRELGTQVTCCGDTDGRVCTAGSADAGAELTPAPPILWPWGLQRAQLRAAKPCGASRVLPTVGPERRRVGGGRGVSARKRQDPQESPSGKRTL